MNWEAVQGVADSIGAVALIVSLVYVAMQIRQNTRSIRASAHQDLLNHVAQLNLRFSEDPTLAELYLRGFSSEIDAWSVDGMRLRSINGTSLRHYAHAFSQFRDGIISSDQWRLFEVSLRRSFRTANMRRDWRFFADEYPSSFRELVEQILHETTPISRVAAQQGAAADEPQPVPIDR